MKRTFVFEFLSRGITWFRLLAISALVTDANYAFIVLLVTAEASVGELIAYPHIREILLAKEVQYNQLAVASVLWLVTLPFQAFAAFWYFE